MKKLHLAFFLTLLCLAITRETNAESILAGSFAPAQNTAILAGGIALTVDEGQVGFKCTLFSYVPATNIQAWLAVGQKELPIDLGIGTRGTWPLQEFFSPVPVAAPGIQTGIDPGFAIPPSSEGTRFIGTFTAPPNLEHLLLAKGGTVYLQVHGTVATLQDPVLSATLQNSTPPVPSHFTALCSGRAEVPSNTSPYHATVQFSLTENSLAYTLTTDAGFAWTSAGIYGPAAQHSNSSKLVAQLDTSLGVFAANPGQTTPASGVTYSGTVTLTDQQAADLKRGLLYVNFLTARYPKGEIRGQILVVGPVHDRRPHRG
jgi:hypothetical protein